MTDDTKIILEPDEEVLEPWEEGLKPVERFEKLIEYGQIGKLVHNSFFKSLDKAGQVHALSQALDSLIGRLDLIARTLLKVSSTHPEGVKVNRIAVALSRAKVKMLDDFVKGVDITAQIGEKSEGKQYF